MLQLTLYKVKWKVLVLSLVCTLASAWQAWNLVIISTQEKDIRSEGIQQPNIVMVLKKFQGATGIDSYWSCLVIFISCQIKLAYFSNNFFPSIKISMLIVFSTPIWKSENINFLSAVFLQSSFEKLENWITNSRPKTLIKA